jgi:hypothetical protein
MQKSPVKDIDVNILSRNWGLEEKFREMRHRAKELEEEIKYKKMKRNKKEKGYKYKIGDVFVAASGKYKQSPEFYLVEVIDYAENLWKEQCEYYCLLQKTTNPDFMKRIGRLVRVKEKENFSWSGSYISDANVENKGIKWLLVE